MGKTTTAALFEKAGIPRYDADATVHQLYAVGGRAVAPIAGLYPDVIVDGGVDRVRLSTHVVGNKAAMATLEAIVHPLTMAVQMAFLRTADAVGVDMVVLDIPLLFEVKAESSVDVIVVVSASPDIQRRRVLARLNMTADRLDAILARQLADSEKRARADFIVDTSRSVACAAAQVGAIIHELRSRLPGTAYARRQAEWT